MVPTALQIRAVFFDLGGTLIDERDYLAWTDVARRHFLDLDPDALAHAYLETETEVDRAPTPVDLVEFWRRTLTAASSHEVSTATAERFVADVRRGEPPARLFSDVRRCLDELRADHRELGVISNSSSEASVRRLLDRTGVIDFFTTVTSSGTEGVRKPDPEIFRRALARAHVEAGESFYVGNLAHTDAEAARAAGLGSVWLHRYGTGFNLDPPEITSLLEVPNWVRRLEGAVERYPTRRAPPR
ncbi:MAG: HAD family hydrolase [Thermoplasmata archaeon]